MTYEKINGKIYQVNRTEVQIENVLYDIERYQIELARLEKVKQDMEGL